MIGKREYGDYQTPDDFASKVCAYLKTTLNITPSAIIEPTCGVGNFLNSSLIFNASELYGIEINPEYCKICKERINDKRVTIINADFFDYNSKDMVKDTTDILIIGNPPWATNSTLSSLESDNLPVKKNFKGLRGIDAITGSSNFDICEYIILQLIDEYYKYNSTIAMLCKTTVAMNIFKELKRKNLGFSKYNIVKFNASKIFGINASACILVIQMNSIDKTAIDHGNVYSFDNPSTVESTFGYIGNQFCSNISVDNYVDLNGTCCFEWRQGVKHDCAKVMELSKTNDLLINKCHNIVDIEDTLVYPLIKSSMFKVPIICNFDKYVIVTQTKVKQDTDYIKYQLPRTWQYLQSNISLFTQRKSSIYIGAPAFSMFGVGEYSFARYKVGISGFYKKPIFSLLYSKNGRPVMLDDTGYFICFDSYGTAYVAMLILNSSKTRAFLSHIVFTDSKRPYTKKILQRISFSKAINAISLLELKQTEKDLLLKPFITENMYDSFKLFIHNTVVHDARQNNRVLMFND